MTPRQDRTGNRDRAGTWAGTRAGTRAGTAA